MIHRLADLGNTLIVIEHNLEVIKTADWVIDLGPEAGLGGGDLVAEGTPEEIVKNRRSHTGRFLEPVLAAGPLAERPRFSLKALAGNDWKIYAENEETGKADLDRNDHEAETGDREIGEEVRKSSQQSGISESRIGNPR